MNPKNSHHLAALSFAKIEGVVYGFDMAANSLLIKGKPAMPMFLPFKAYEVSAIAPEIRSFIECAPIMYTALQEIHKSAQALLHAFDALQLPDNDPLRHCTEGIQNMVITANTSVMEGFESISNKVAKGQT